MLYVFTDFFCFFLSLSSLGRLFMKQPNLINPLLFAIIFALILLVLFLLLLLFLLLGILFLAKANKVSLVIHSPRVWPDGDDCRRARNNESFRRNLARFQSRWWTVTWSSAITEAPAVTVDSSSDRRRKLSLSLSICMCEKDRTLFTVGELSEKSNMSQNVMMNDST